MARRLRNLLILLLCLSSWTGLVQAQSPRTPPGDPDDDAPAAAAPRAALSPQEVAAIEALRTRAEVSGFEATSNYEETLDYLHRLQAHFPEMYLGFYGTSGEGR